MSIESRATPMDGRRSVLLLAAITLLGFLARAYGTSWGLPDFVFLDSARFFIDPAVALVRDGDWSPRQFMHTPTLVYVLAALYAPARAMGIDHVWGPGRLPVETRSVLWIGRGLVVLLSTAQIPVVYALGKRLFDTRTALLAAAVTAVLPLAVLESHRINADVPMVLVVLLSVWAAARAEHDRSAGWLCGSFGLAGLAAAFKLPGLAAIMVPTWVALTWPRAAWGRRAAMLLAGLLLASAVVVTLCFAMVLHWQQLGETLSRAGRVGFLMGRPGVDLLGQRWFYRRYVYWLVAGLPFALGWAAYLAAVGGIVRLARVRDRSAIVLFAAMAPFFVVQGFATTVEPRYFLYLCPFLALAAGLGLAAASRSYRRVGAVAAVLVLTYTALLTISQDLRIGLESQRRVGALLDQIALRRASRSRLVVAYPTRNWLNWDPIAVQLRARRVRVVAYPSGRRRSDVRTWAERGDVDVVIVPSQVGDILARNGGRGPHFRFLDDLASDRSGFVLAGRHRPRFFTDWLYTSADPIRATSLVAGVIGYDVWERVGKRPGATPGVERRRADSPRGSRRSGRRPHMPPANGPPGRR